MPVAVLGLIGKILSLWLLAVIFAVALSHGLLEHALQSALLCLDPSSVQVTLESVTSEKEKVLTQAFLPELIETLRHAFSVAKVRVEWLASCEGSRSFVLFSTHISYLDPEVYLGFGDDPYSYTMGIQVGHYGEFNSLQRDVTLTSPLFLTVSSDIHSEEGTLLLEELLLQRGRALVMQLVVAWWEDNPVIRRSWFTPQVVGVGLAFLVALFWGARYRRRST